MTNEPNIRTEVARIVKDAGATLFDCGEYERITEGVTAYVEGRCLPHEETADLIMEARLEELRLVLDVLAAVVDAQNAGEDEEVVPRVLEHIGDRRNAIRLMAARRPD
ncbi:hypothetical protein ACFT5D_07780 [Streptomyces sp. NPDC057144]|uniref:hypothetical protein n=1 Tax=Streptomyces sp. NPDC057144 TaxID=3346034 RepID=UPI00362B168D